LILFGTNEFFKCSLKRNKITLRLKFDSRNLCNISFPAIGIFRWVRACFSNCKAQRAEIHDSKSAESFETIFDDARDSRTATIQTKKSEPGRGNHRLGIYMVFMGVIGIMAGLDIAGIEPLPALSGRLSALVHGAVPLVYAHGRNAAIGTVICSAVMLVILILVFYPTGASSVHHIPSTPSTDGGGKKKYEK
jgi:hypothetical protein